LSAHACHFPAGTRGVLVVVNGWQDARATARLVATLHAGESARIHVAAVQGRPSGYAGRFLRRVDVRKVLEETARESMAALCAELDRLGVAYRAHVEIAPWLDGIARLARELGCGRIVVGVNPRRGMRDVALRMDRWRLRATLRAQGLACLVVRGDESAVRARASVAAGSAAQS